MALGDGVRGDAPVASSGRGTAEQKGSLLILPVVEVRWSSSNGLVQDTFIGLFNDYYEAVRVQLYFVNGDPPLEAVGGERPHAGWNSERVGFGLGGNEPAYWSAATGAPKGLPPWTLLDPGSPPGRPDPEEVSDERVLRGYIVAWAVDSRGHEIRWNQLGGMATVVDYAAGTVWEYPAWAFQVHGVPHGDEPISCLAFNLESGQCVDSAMLPGQIDLDGFEYDACPGALMFEFRAAGSTLPAPGSADLDVQTRLVLFPCDMDLRQDTTGPVVTKARFDIWNQDEVQLSGTDRCIIGWDMTLLASYTTLGVPNHFLIDFLGTDRGKARVQGVHSGFCDVDGWVSRDAALLGVMQGAVKFIGKDSKTAMPLSIQGEQVAQILADIGGSSGERPGGGGG